LVQVDTLQVWLITNEVHFQFNAHDIATKFSGMRAHKKQISTAAAAPPYSEKDL
jgi:hypothetical protein